MPVATVPAQDLRSFIRGDSGQCDTIGMNNVENRSPQISTTAPVSKAAHVSGSVPAVPAGASEVMIR